MPTMPKQIGLLDQAVARTGYLAGYFARHAERPSFKAGTPRLRPADNAFRPDCLPEPELRPGKSVIGRQSGKWLESPAIPAFVHCGPGRDGRPTGGAAGAPRPIANDLS